MIRKDKFENALYSFQEILIKVRDMAYKDENNNKIALLLDYLEYLPKMFVTKEDDTEKYLEVIQEISNTFNLQYIVDIFNNDLPDQW